MEYQRWNEADNIHRTETRSGSSKTFAKAIPTRTTLKGSEFLDKPYLPGDRQRRKRDKAPLSCISWTIANETLMKPMAFM